MSLSEIVSVQISRQTRFPTQIAFGVPMIISQHTAFTETFREYTGIDGVSEDFSSSTNEYKAASAIFNQNPSVERLKIGRKLANVAEEVRITPTAVDEYTYQITVRGVLYTYTSDDTATVAEVIAGFVSAMAAADDLTASNQTTYLRILANTAGLGLTAVVGDNLAIVTQTANIGAESALSAIALVNDDFYGIMCTSRTAVDVLACAQWAEARTKIFVTASDDSNVLDAASTSDIAYILNAKNYDRSFCLYSGDVDNFPDAAVLGMALPYDPGSITLKFKELNGIIADALTETQKTSAENKSCNTYITVASIDMLEQGVMASGEFADVIMGIDWIVANIQEEVFATLANEPKIPYTNAGVDAIKTKVYAVLTEAIEHKILRSDPKPIVSAPDVKDISIANRSARTLPDVVFSAQLAGAIHKAEIRGTISV